MSGPHAHPDLVPPRRQRPYAGRIYDFLRAKFGKSVFIDIDSIAPGEDFRESLLRNLKGCDVVLAVIGNDWLSITDNAGRRRLDAPGDYVRMEIAAALQGGIRVVPVLVGGASVPDLNDLPEPLHPLIHRQAVDLADNRFREDPERLASSLIRLKKGRKVIPLKLGGAVAGALITVGAIIGLVQWAPTSRVPLRHVSMSLSEISFAIHQVNQEQSRLVRRFLSG